LFAVGVDVRLPTSHKHLCGPLCNFHLDELRQRSPWAGTSEATSSAIAQRRPVRFFWAGSSRWRNNNAHNPARDMLLSHHEGRPGWRVLRLGAQGGMAARLRQGGSTPTTTAARGAALGTLGTRAAIAAAVARAARVQKEQHVVRQGVVSPFLRQEGVASAARGDGGLGVVGAGGAGGAGDGGAGLLPHGSVPPDVPARMRERAARQER
jgi:hypothetical protein